MGLFLNFEKFGKISKRMTPVVQLYPHGGGPCADFQLGLWISANSVGNINTAKSPQKSIKQANVKGTNQLGQKFVWIIHLYLFIYYTQRFTNSFRSEVP